MPLFCVMECFGYRRFYAHKCNLLGQSYAQYKNFAFGVPEYVNAIGNSHFGDKLLIFNMSSKQFLDIQTTTQTTSQASVHKTM